MFCKIYHFGFWSIQDHLNITHVTDENSNGRNTFIEGQFDQQMCLLTFT